MLYNRLLVWGAVCGVCRGCCICCGMWAAYENKGEVVDGVVWQYRLFVQTCM